MSKAHGSAMGGDLERLLRLADPAGDRDLLGQLPSGDGAALTELVRRHGPLVLGVCRRVLGHEQDAEDAFQATFLVLTARAGSVRKAGSVGAWLYGTARHVALRLRDKERRRRRHETAARRSEAVVERPGQDEWRDVLDEELRLLPDLLQKPLVACYLAGRTQEDVARELGWSLSTLRRRLDRGRELLRARLVRRGVTLPAGAVLVGAVEPVPRALAEAVIQAVARFTGGDRGSAPAVLAQGVLTMMSRAKLAKAGAVALSLVGAVVVWQAAGGAAQPAPTHPTGGQGSKTDPPPAAPKADTVVQPAGPVDDRIKPGDRLFIRAKGTFESDPIEGVYVVEKGGAVALGPAYGGRVSVAGLTPEKAEAVVQARLLNFLRTASVQLTMADPADSPAGLERRVRQLEQEVLELRAAIRELRKGP
ncbi:sigma-70 family RNA polymerase sigma factor [bacterium]|nr:sigma-70 family RNA polymerase sigma factor [bacterium]